MDQGNEMLAWRDDLPVPVAGKGDVLIRVGAACLMWARPNKLGLKDADYILRQGERGQMR